MRNPERGQFRVTWFLAAFTFAVLVAWLLGGCEMGPTRMMEGAPEFYDTSKDHAEVLDCVERLPLLVIRVDPTLIELDELD